MKRKLMLFLSFLIIGIGLVSAQNSKVTGVVISEDDGQPIIGASVSVKGTRLGSITDENGKFVILGVPASAKTVAISYIGMATQQVDLKPNLRIVLRSSEDKALNEVVVVAYGTASKSSLTGSVSAVDAKQIAMRPVTNAAGVLEGSAAGIQVNNTYGEPGNDKMKIRIRGFGSVNGTNNPLIVLDGSPYDGSLNDINSSDIESMTVLKDAASSALYGNKAANGVVLITTKRGKSDRLNFNLSTRQGVYTRGIPEYKRMDTADWMETMWKGYKRYYTDDEGLSDANAATSATANLIGNIVKQNIYKEANGALFDTNGNLTANQNPLYNDLDWNDALQRSGYRQEYTATVDASTDKYNVFSSLSYLNEKGYIICSGLERLSGRLNADFHPTKWLKTGLNLAASSRTSNYASSAEGTSFVNPFYTSRMMAPVYPIYKHNSDGSYALDNVGNKQYNLYQQYLERRHIIYELKNNKNQLEASSLNAQAYGTVTFLKDFTATVKGSLYNSNLTQTNYDNPVCGDGAGNNGRLTLKHEQKQSYNVSQELTWNHDFDVHHIDILAAHEAYKYTDSQDSESKANMKMIGNIQLSNFSKLTDITGYKDEYTTESYLGRARYNYNEKYYVDASFRSDGSSRFYHPWGTFWSAGASWMISKENFMKNLSWVNTLKLRTSYGQVGNDAGAGYYAYRQLYYSDTNASLGAFYKTQNANKDLKWETSSTLDIAVEGRLFERLNFSIDYFDKTSHDLLFNAYSPLSAGATDFIENTDDSQTGMSLTTKNIGSVSNRGVEFAADVDVIKNRDWKWNVGLNLTYLKNKITKLPNHTDILHGSQKYSEGHSIYEFFIYTYAGVDQMNGQALYDADTKYSNDKSVTSGSAVKINDNYYVYNTSYAKKDWHGSALPKVYGSINTSLSYKDLTLSVLGTYSLGGKTYDGTYASLMTMSANSPNAIHQDMLKAWNGTPSGITEASVDRIDKNGITRADLSSNESFSTAATSSRWLKSSSYFVLKNVNLNYNLPTEIVHKWGLGGVGLNATIENVFTVTALRGMNPQYDFNGSSDNTFVTARVYSLGLTLKF